MRRVIYTIIILLAVLLSFECGHAGEVKRIGYIEAGPFWVYTHTLNAFKNALARQDGVVAEFPPELHVSVGWDKDQDAMDKAVNDLMARDDVDLIVSCGVSANRTITARGDGAIPVIGMGMSDPLLAGVIVSPDDSGRENFTCEVVVDRWKQMFRVFHEVVGFKRLGLLYSGILEGKVDSGLSDALEVGRELGYEVIAQQIPDEESGSCVGGLQALHEKDIDAFFVGPLSCFDWEFSDPAPLLQHINSEYQWPTFARDGSAFVEGGALMGFSTWDFEQIGERQAEKAVAIFRGASPRSLPMRVGIEPILAINLQTAREIGFDFPFEVIIAADAIFTTTSRPDEGH